MSFFALNWQCKDAAHIEQSRIYISALSCYNDYIIKYDLYDPNESSFSEWSMLIGARGEGSEKFEIGDIPDVHEPIHQLSPNAKLTSEVKSHIDSMWNQLTWVDYRKPDREEYKAYVKENGLLYILSPIFIGETTQAKYIFLMRSTKHEKIIRIDMSGNCEILFDSDL